MGRNTRLTTTLLHDPLYPIAATQVVGSGPASPEPEVVKLSLLHQYLDDVNIRIDAALGEDFGLWMVMGYSL